MIEPRQVNVIFVKSIGIIFMLLIKKAKKIMF